MERYRWQSKYSLWNIVLVELEFLAVQRWRLKQKVFQIAIQVDLVFRWLLTYEFAYSLMWNWPKRPSYQLKCVFLSASLVFSVQNTKTYQPRITRPTCIMQSFVCLGFIMKSKKLFRCTNSIIYITFCFLTKSFKTGMLENDPWPQSWPRTNKAQNIVPWKK